MTLIADHAWRTAALLILLATCGRQSSPRPTPALDPLGPSEVRAMVAALADDSMQGRATATPGGDRAARFIADRMREYGLVPAGDSGWFQRVPLAAITD